MRARTVGLLVCLFAWSMSTHGKPSSSGDEPYYLLATHSLLVDRDLDLANNFAQDDGRHVGADGLASEAHVARTSSGAVMSVHDVGLSLLALPAYAAGRALGSALSDSTLERFRMSRGRFAYAVVSLWFVLITSLGAALLTAGLRLITTPRMAAAMALTVTLCPPVLPFTFLVFPEAPAFAIVCTAIWASLSARTASSLPVARIAIALCAAGQLPWFHRKFSFLALALVAAIGVSAWPHLRSASRRTLALCAGAFVLPFALFYVHSLTTWGTIAGPQLMGDLPFSVAGVPTGAMGLLFDRSRGLIPYAPIYLLAPFAWWMAGRSFRVWLLAVAAIYVPMAAFVTWDAGYSPAARFLVPIMPAVALPAALALHRTAFRYAAAVLLVLQLAMVAYAWQRPRALWPGEVGDNRLLNAMPIVGPVLNHLFPVINEGTWRQ